MSMLLKEIERIEALAENKRDLVKLANFWKMYALELRDQSQAEKAELVRQCAEIAHEYNRSGKQAWLDKYGDVRLVDAMMTLLTKE